MNFVSTEWIFWLVITVSLYWLVPHLWRDRFLIVITAAFLIWVDPVSFTILVSMSLGIFQVLKSKPVPGWIALSAGIMVVLVLVYFKWNANANVDSNISIRDIVVPLGLAYYSIRLLIYIIDSYIGNIPKHRLEHFIAYLFFLPTIVVGPIHRFQQFVTDYQYKRWNAKHISEGLQRIVYGYAKIVILGNYLISGIWIIWELEIFST